MSFETKAEPETGPVSETMVGGVQGEHVPYRTGGDVAGLGAAQQDNVPDVFGSVLFHCELFGC